MWKQRILFVLLFLNASSGIAQQPDEGKRVDLYGDPLPHGAIARLGTLRLRHAHDVNCGAFHPDGKTLATSSSDGSVCFWDIATGRRLRKQLFDGSFTRSVAFASGGRRYLVVDGNGTVTVCQTETGRRLQVLRIGASWSGAQFSPDGTRILAAVRDKGVQIWQLNDGGRLLVECVGDFDGATYSPDGTWFAAWGGGLICRMCSQSGQTLAELAGHSNTIRSVHISPDGRLIASAGEDGTLRLWDAISGRELWVVTDAHGGRAVSCVRFSPDGTKLATAGYDRSVRFWDVAEGRQVRSFDGQSQREVRWSPDGKLVASYGANGTSVRIRDAVTGADRPALTGHYGVVREMLFLPNGSLITAGSNDRTLRVWDTETGRQLHCLTDAGSRLAAVPNSRLVVAAQRNRLELYDVQSGTRRVLASVESKDVYRNWMPAVSKDGQRMVTITWMRRVNSDGRMPESTLLAWDLPSGKVLRSLTGREGLTSAQFLPDGKSIVVHSQVRTDSRRDDPVGYADKLEILSFPGLTESRTIYSQTSEREPTIRHFAVSPDGSHVAVACGSAGSKAIEVATGRTVHLWNLPDDGHHDKISFSNDGRRILGGPRPYFVWDAETGELVQTISEGRGCGRLSPDGRMLATGHDDGAVSLWDVKSGRRLIRFEGHDAGVRAVAFSADGTRLASSSYDCTVLCWSLNPADWPGPEAPSSPPDLDDLWRDLGAFEAKTAYRAAHQMAERPRETVAFLEPRLTAGFWAEPRSFDNAETRRYHRAAFVLQQIDSEDARRIRERIQVPRLSLPPVVVARTRTDALGDPLPHGAILRGGTHRYYLGHDDCQIALSSDGHLAATAQTGPGRLFQGNGASSPIRLWDTDSGKLVRTVSCPAEIVRLELSGSAEFLVCTSGNNDMVVLDAIQGNILRQWKTGIAGTVTALAVSADGKSAVTGHENGTIVTWDLNSGKRASQAELPQTRIVHLRLADERRLHVIGLDQQTCRQQAGILDRGRWVFRTTSKPDGILAISADGKTYAESTQREIVSRSIDTGQEVERSALGDLFRLRPADVMQFLPEGQWLLSGRDELSIVDGRGCRRYHFRPTSFESVLALSSDARFLAFVAEDRLRILDLKAGRDVTAQTLRKVPTAEFLVSSDGGTVLSVDAAQCWRRDPISLVPLAPVAITGEPKALSRDGRFCATSAGQQITVWELATGTVVCRAKSVYSDRSLAFHSDGRHLVLATGGTVQVLDLLTGTVASTWNLPREWTNDVVVSPDGKTLLARHTVDSAVRLMDALTGKRLWQANVDAHTFRRSRFVVGGEFFVLSSLRENTWEFRNARTGVTARKVSLPDEDAELFDASCDLATLVIGAEREYDLAVYDVPTGQRVFDLDPGPVKTARFLPDERRVITTSANVTTIWDLSTVAAPRHAGESVARQLDRLWPDLLSEDGEKAFAALWVYVAAGDAAVDSLNARLLVARKKPPTAEEVQRLIEQLDDDNFESRERATQRLLAIGQPAVRYLRQAASERSRVELRLGSERVLSAITARLSLQRIRVTMVLRRVGSTRARELLSQIE